MLCIISEKPRIPQNSYCEYLSHEKPNCFKFVSLNFNKNIKANICIYIYKQYNLRINYAYY